MNKSLIIFTLLFGFLIVAHKTEAAVEHINTFKSMEILQKNPLDPREANDNPIDTNASEE